MRRERCRAVPAIRQTNEFDVDYKRIVVRR